VPKRTLTFTIEVTDEEKTIGTPFRVRRTFGTWRRIGVLMFDNAVVSYNGDAGVHFTHPIPGGTIATIRPPARA
jgi:hypothetical protein